ncbi:MAG: hypothetical protein J1F35_07895 [Erysipelotrichales bacterium]|nr:hypothetical protein [Erysipelotrichales bacterium]
METFNRLVEINKRAAQLYALLADYEMLGDAYSEQYYKMVDAIKGLRKQADEVIEAVDDELIEEEEAFANKMQYTEDSDFTIDALLDKTEQFAEKRSTSLVYYYCLINHVGEIDYDDDLTEEQKEAFEEYLKRDNDLLDIEYIREQIQAHILLDYIKLALEQEQDEKVRERLIKAKYNLICVTTCVEEAFLNNPKSFSERVKYIDTLIYRGLTEEEADEYGEYIKHLLVVFINDLESLPNEYFDSIDNQIDAYLESFYLKTIYSMNISEHIENVIENSRKELETKNKPVTKYLKDSLDKNLAYRIYKKN